MSRRAKIVCTLGPVTTTDAQIRALIGAGMDVARMNFSHGSHADHAERIATVRAEADAAGKAVGVLADLQGPKIRLNRFEAGRVVWNNGQLVTITTEPGHGSAEKISTSYPELSGDVHPGDRLLIDDGNIALQVIRVDGPDVSCVVVEGGPVSDHKGINLPGVKVSATSMSEKDLTDLRFALAQRVDFVALSFVRSPGDVLPVRAVMAEEGYRCPVIAKIEKPEAVEGLDEIIRAFDGVMIARGDLGVEMPLEQVPHVQKRAIQLARELAKPVIVATQMLESMISHSRPTRAEVSDVANAVLDGADALMLSAETSVGAFPIAAVATMSRVITAAEEQGLDEMRPLRTAPLTRGGAIARAAIDVATTTGSVALVAFTQSGDTVRRLARHRSAIPLLAFTPIPEVRRQLALSWGVETFLAPSVAHTDDMVVQVDVALLELGRGVEGDEVVVVAGSPPNTSGSTNAMRVHRLGHIVGPRIPSLDREDG